MAASATTANKNSTLSWFAVIGKILYLIFVLVIAFMVDKYAAWNWSVIWLFIGALGFIFLFLPSELRRLGLFALLNLYLVIDFSIGLYRLLTSNEGVMAAIRNSAALTFLLGGTDERLVWSILLGVIGALLITLVPLFIIAAISALFVLGLHKMEGISWWDATVNIMFLILGINAPYILIENGQAVITKEASKLGVMAGLGHLLIKQGNVVVLERGGKITRIVNAGTVNLRPLETIRNIFALNVQSSPAETTKIEHVLTKDRIPLTITLKMSFQIEPASEADKRDESRLMPNGEGLTPKLNDGLYQVYEGTVRKAALMSQRVTFEQNRYATCEHQFCQDIQVTTWQKVAGSAPEAELRDHIMSHRFDELFQLDNSSPDEKPPARVNKRKVYEIEQAILNDIKPKKIAALGVLVRGVDIAKIEFPPEARDLLINRWGAPWQQQIDLIGVEGSVEAKLLIAQRDREAKMLTAEGDREIKALTAQSDQEIKMLAARSGLEIAELEARFGVTRARLEAEARSAKAELEAEAIVIRARANAQARILQGQGEGEARAAFFREVIREIKREARLGNEEMVTAVLKQLISTMVSVEDLQTFIKATAFVTQPSRGRLEVGSGQINGNGTSRDEDLENE